MNFKRWLEQNETLDSSKPKIVVYPNMQGMDFFPEGAEPQGSETVVDTNSCIGNEPGKDFNYFKTGTSDKGKLSEYVAGIVKAAKSKGINALPPVKAIPHPMLSGKYLVIDGNHRLASFKIGGIPKIKAAIVALEDVKLAVPGTKWAKGIEPQSVSIEEAKSQGYNLNEYFNSKDLTIPPNDTWVQSLKNGSDNATSQPSSANKFPATLNSL